MGPASAPPAMSVRSTFASSMNTAIAMSGSLANDTNHAYGFFVGSVCAVPVLPPTTTPATCAFVPVPFWTTLTIICCSAWADGAVMACLSSGPCRYSTRRSALRTSLTRYGVLSTPSLQIAETIIAICKGLAATSYCPIALSMVCAASTLVGNWLFAASTSLIGVVLNPNFSAWARILSAPSVAPRFANAVLHDNWSALSMVCWVLPQFDSLPSTLVEFGSVSWDGVLMSCLLYTSDAADE